MGSKKYKKHHHKYYDNKWNKRIEVFNPLQISGKKNNLVVEKIK